MAMPCTPLVPGMVATTLSVEVSTTSVWVLCETYSRWLALST